MRGEAKVSNRANLTVAIDETLLNQLRIEAKKGRHSINTKVNTILAKHVQFYRHVEAQRGIILPSKFWKKIVDQMDENKMMEIFGTEGNDTVLTLFEHDNIPLTMENLIKYVFDGMALWAGGYHRFTSNTDSMGYLNLVFEHDYNLKWSRVFGTAIVQLIEMALGLKPELKVLPSIITIKVKV